MSTAASPSAATSPGAAPAVDKPVAIPVGEAAANLPLLATTKHPPDGGNVISSILAESSHPTALLFHFGFRTAALLVYLLASLLLGSSFVFTVVLTVVLLALDFWTVKNITGRLLVGRRWWSSMAADGSSLWTFEARPAPWRPNPADSRLFWGSLYLYTAMWVGLALVAMLRFNFSWLLVVAFALTLNGTNLVGYIKCDREAQSQMLNSWGTSMIGGLVGSKLNSFFA